MDGGIFGLLAVLRDHRGALEYDFRHRFGLGVYSIGQPGSPSLTEAGRLVRILVSDPSSMTAASVQGWDYPISQETIVLADIFDLEHYINADPKKGRPKPHAIRPFKTDARATEKYGNTGGRSPERVREILEQARLGTA